MLITIASTYFLHFVTSHHLHTSIHHINLVERSMPDVVVHVHCFGIAAHLCLGLLHGSLHLSIRGLALQIFQFDDVRMFHIGEYLAMRTKEDVGIASLVVQLGDGTVVAAKARQCECIAVYEGFSLLAVALRSIGVDAVGNKAEESLNSPS